MLSWWRLNWWHSPLFRVLFPLPPSPSVWDPTRNPPSLPPKPNSRMHPASFISRKATAMANDGDCVHGGSSARLPAQGWELPFPQTSPLLPRCEGEQGSRQKGRGMGTVPWTSPERQTRQTKNLSVFQYLVSHTFIVAVLRIHHTKCWRRFTVLTRTPGTGHHQQHMVGCESPHVFRAQQIGWFILYI